MISASLVKELRELTGAGMLDCKKALEACEGDKDKAVDWLREKGISKAAKKASRIAAEGRADILVEGNSAVIVEVNSETDFVAKNAEFTGLVNDILTSIMNGNPETVEDALKLTVNGETVEDLIINKTAKIGEKLSLRRFAKLTKCDNEVFGSYIHGGRIAVLTVLEGTNEEVAKHVSMQAASMRPSYVRISDVPEEVVAREAEVLKEQAMNEGKPAEIAEKMVQGRLQKFYKEICLEEQEFILDGDINVKTYVKNNGGSIKEMVRYEVGEGMEKREENFAEEVAKQING
ncbi:elongation factor Ts [Firmicutes bacterium CAG:884]|nr:translation elongation factor Ts [Bacillota bacterium]CCY94517.1 elongation factor Ts [Firmicutes bacterium CAG:884]